MIVKQQPQAKKIQYTITDKCNVYIKLWDPQEETCSRFESARTCAEVLTVPKLYHPTFQPPVAETSLLTFSILFLLHAGGITLIGIFQKHLRVLLGHLRAHRLAVRWFWTSQNSRLLSKFTLTSESIDNFPVFGGFQLISKRTEHSSFCGVFPFAWL